MDQLKQAAEGFRTISADAQVKERALTFLRQWLTEPAFAGYRPQIEWLIQEQQWAGLLDRFYQILPFGTGGRRGAVGIGPNRMNLWTLAASVQGHCEYLRERFPGGKAAATPHLHVVLAFDVRRFEDRRKQYNPALPNPVLHLSSKDLAQHAACVYAANGIHASILPPDSSRYYATPELSFVIRELQANGGLNISASHNPPDDNGGKFYDERGGQPVPPDDQIMADLVDQVTTIREMPWADVVRSGRIHFLKGELHDGYIDLIRRQSLVPPPRKEEIKVVFTPLHGVGGSTALEVLVKQGFTVIPVEEQMAPDGMFPNVSQTPNPEVPVSMDRAEQTARKVNADLVLATDPDADRLGAMIPDRAGGWRYVNGNEIASLLTYFKLNKLALAGSLPPSALVITTEVTTGQLTRIARHFKVQIVNNLLVGFKYHADVLWHLEKDGAYEDVRGTPEDLVIAAEESHGILVTPKIRDKDAGGAALLMAELVLDQKRKALTALDLLDHINKQFGYYRNLGVTVAMTGLQGKQDMARMLDALRSSPPKQIAGLDVTAFEDLRDEEGRLGPLRGATDAASRNVLIFRLGERARVVLRPSGTEPKAKTYIEAASAPFVPGTTLDAWQRTCREVDELAQRLGDDFQRLALRLIGKEPGK
jgi:phosphoglucomutase/phosphomannomutase